jgi:hypothetical protein
MSEVTILKSKRSGKYTITLKGAKSGGPIICHENLEAAKEKFIDAYKASCIPLLRISVSRFIESEEKLLIIKKDLEITQPVKCD